MASNQTLPVHQNKETDNFKKLSKTAGLNNKKSHEAHTFMNNSNSINAKVKNQNSIKNNNLHIASVDNDSTLTPTSVTL